MIKFDTFGRARHFLRNCLLGYLLILAPQFASAQSLIDKIEIDPQLEELVEIIKSRSESPEETYLQNTANLTPDELYVDAVETLLTASYSGVPQTIFEAVTTFEGVYKSEGRLDLSQIKPLFMDYSQGLEAKKSSNELQIVVHKYMERGNWFEKFVAFEVSVYHHANLSEHQAALQKAQLALRLIPQNVEGDIYAKYAKSQIIGTIAHLYSLQGNSVLALEASLDYLHLTQGDPIYEDEIDLINNLIYSYRVSRNHEAQLFLSKHLLELEKTHSSSVPGLSEMRIASGMNSANRFNEALDYAVKALEKSENLIVIRHSQINKAVALAGLGRSSEARKVGEMANVDFSSEHMLKVEKSENILYLAFLLAQKEDPKYAIQLVNRQHDMMAQKFHSNKSRDTTAMLANLENTRERQAERDAAAAREAELQAMTIDRQRNLNRALIFLLFLLGGIAISAICFARYRSRMVHQLQIKTKEAASAEKLKTDFLGMISHELRTPLNGIIGISDFLTHYHEDADIRKKTGIILRSGNELLTVVESLTDMARLDAGQLELAPFDADLNLSLIEAPKGWAAKAKDKGIVFTSFIDPSLAQHHVDEDRLLQCLNILMENAVRFTDAGRVHVHITANTAAEEKMVSSLTAVVADTGQGMTDLVLSRLFTPFMQADTSRKRSHMGTGLSLAIAYALADMMGGKLSVVSRQGRGSEFTLDVPLKAALHPLKPSLKLPLQVLNEGPSIKERAQVTETPHQVIDPPKSSVSDIPVLDKTDVLQREVIDLMTPRMGRSSLHHAERSVSEVFTDNKQRILIVDDIASNRDAVRYILESHGHACSEAADGFTALAKLDQQPYDLMILDIHMSPLDGVETLRRLRSSQKPYAYIPVIALTADNAARINAACMDAGADLFLTKPIQRAELMAALSYLNQTDGARILSQ